MGQMAVGVGVTIEVLRRCLYENDSSERKFGAMLAAAVSFVLMAEEQSCQQTNRFSI